MWHSVSHRKCRIGAPSEDGVIEDEDDDRTDHCHKHAVEIETRDPGSPELHEQEASDDRSDDAQNDVEDEPFAALVDHFTAYEAGNQPENDPTQNGHRKSLRNVIR